MQTDPKLAALRNELDAVDAMLMQTIAKRQAIVAQIGAVKRASGHALRDFKREREVLVHVRKRASDAGLDSDLAERVMIGLIESSLQAQEQERIKQSDEGTGQSALVIGGGGRMGLWFASFLRDQGFSVSILDTNTDELPFQRINALSELKADPDLIVLATPITVSSRILQELSRSQTTALIIDIASIKTPQLDGLRACAKAGKRVCAIHPMFGPDTQLLSGKHVLFSAVGDAQAVTDAKALFAATSAELIDVALDQHDELIAFVLGLSHALNIVFFTALKDSGAAAQTLMQLSSTTFDRQLAVASKVAAENPHLYYEIQSLNPAQLNALDSLSAALEKLRSSVASGDRDAFVTLMTSGQQYLQQRGHFGRVGGAK
jgi:chorismate mutase / prephenate dehydrogenase